MNDNYRLQRELKERTRELEEARREIERLHVTTQQVHLREFMAEIEQTDNAKFSEMNQKFENIHLQVSNLQRAESEQIRQIVRNSNNFDGVCSELNPHVSVILFGGSDGDRNSEIGRSICLYNSKEKKWINSSLELPDTLTFHESVILNDKIYIFGGRSDKGQLKSTHKLGENGEWIKLADMNMARYSFGSLVFEDEIWVFGGANKGPRLKTVEKYNPQRNTWTLMPQMNQAKDSPAVSIINGKFYVSGGFCAGKYLDKIEVFDPKKNKWGFFCNMPVGLCEHTSTVDGTNLIIIGGVKSFYEVSNEVWKIDVLDPKKEWKKMPNLKQKRCDHSAVKLVDGLMVIGGDIESSSFWSKISGRYIRTKTDSVEIFDGQKWKKGPKLPEKRNYFSSIPLNNKNEEKFFQLLSYKIQIK